MLSNRLLSKTLLRKLVYSARYLLQNYQLKYAKIEETIARSLKRSSVVLGALPRRYHHQPPELELEEASAAVETECCAIFCYTLTGTSHQL